MMIPPVKRMKSRGTGADGRDIDGGRSGFGPSELGRRGLASLHAA